jgi:uncharacterized protein
MSRRRIYPTARLARFAACLPLILPLVACSRDAVSSAPATGPGQAALPPNDMHFESMAQDIKGKKFTLEIADDNAKIERGLMYRDSMAADRGMFFLLPYADTWSFWMKNTRIPLDIVYLDPAGRVVAIHERRPFDETGMAPRTPARFVIELNAGTAAAIGLRYGDAVALPEKYLKAATTNSDKNN